VIASPISASGGILGRWLSRGRGEARPSYPVPDGANALFIPDLFASSRSPRADHLSETGHHASETVGARAFPPPTWTRTESRRVRGGNPLESHVAPFRESRWGFEPVFREHQFATRILALIRPVNLNVSRRLSPQPDSEHVVGVRQNGRA
jgi:hypothetical protein